jgi:hypothetical protein
MKFSVVVSGGPVSKIEPQSEYDVTEQAKKPAVTEGAVRITDQGSPLTAPSGTKTNLYGVPFVA